MRTALWIPAIFITASGLFQYSAKGDERGVSFQPGPAVPRQPAKNEYKEDAQVVAEGKRLYNAFNCVGCHAHGGGAVGPALMDAKWIYGNEPEQIFATVVEGRPNGMPSFRHLIPDDQIWQIVAYVRSLGGLTQNAVPPGGDNALKGNQPEQPSEPPPPKN